MAQIKTKDERAGSTIDEAAGSHAIYVCTAGGMATATYLEH